MCRSLRSLIQLIVLSLWPDAASLTICVRDDAVHSQRKSVSAQDRQTDGRTHRNHDRDLLLPRIRRVLVRRVAVHPIVRDLARVRHRVAPERLRLDPEVPYHPAGDVAERERDGAAVAVLAGARRVVRPPRLAVPVDAARRVRVDDEVAAGDDEPGGLVLDEDDAVGVVGVEPVLDVWLELSANYG